MDDLLTRLQAALADQYTLERELGRGGMATVYLARDLKHRRPVAMKMLRPDVAAALGADRFLREIAVAARLTHPHILPLHDSGQAEGVLYYVMPYVDGESLRERLKRQGQLPIEEAVTIAREVADALSYAHSHEVIHRDVKPENVLLWAGHAAVSDFGIAHAIDFASTGTLTRTGEVIGTPAYMSPEQAGGEKTLDARTDLYSLGCVLYEMLAGEPPFTGPTARAVIARQFSGPVPSIFKKRPEVPALVAQALTRALAKEPMDRFGTADAFAAALVVQNAAFTWAEKSIAGPNRLSKEEIALKFMAASVGLPEKLTKRLLLASAAEGVSPQKVIEQAVKEFLKRKRL